MIASFENSRNKFADNPFLVGHENEIFRPDERLGFVHRGGEFIGEKDFVSFEQTLYEIKNKPWQPVMLNLGDSSTSGWESDAVSKSKASELTSKDPFFHYKTYSDLLRVHELHVVNAGVSGYSSLQGKIHLQMLLRRFAKSGVNVDYVTLYFGNNDGVYSSIEDRVAIEAMRPSPKHELCRVTVGDYRKNVSSMIETVYEYGAEPVVIVPVVNPFWKPGLRSSKHEEEYHRGIDTLRTNPLQTELLEARRAFSQGKLYEAYAKDRFLPRIKFDYLKTLNKTAKNLHTFIIDVQDYLPVEEDNSYFRDYCHPLEPINELIVTRFKEILRRNHRKPQYEMMKEVRETPNVYPLW